MIYEVCNVNASKCGQEGAAINVSNSLQEVQISNLDWNGAEVCRYYLNFTWVKNMMYKEQFVLNVTEVKNVTLYITAGQSAEGAITIHSISSPTDVDLATFNKSFIYAVPDEGASENGLNFTIQQISMEQEEADSGQMKLLVSVGVTFGGLFAFLMAGGLYIAYKKVKGMLNKKIKINQAPSGEI